MIGWMYSVAAPRTGVTRDVQKLYAAPRASQTPANAPDSQTMTSSGVRASRMKSFELLQCHVEVICGHRTDGAFTIDMHQAADWPSVPLKPNQAKFMKIMKFHDFFELPIIVPRLFWTTHGMFTGPETLATMVYSCLLDLHRPRRTGCYPEWPE